MAAPSKSVKLFVLCALGLIALTTCTQPSLQVARCYEFELLERAFKSLSSALSFMDSVKNHLTVDAMLGVVIVKEQSESLLRLLDASLSRSKENLNSQLFLVKRQLVELHQRSREVSAAMPFVWGQNPHYFREIGGILNPIIWSKVSCHSKALAVNETSHHHLASSNITLNEKISDFCLAEVLNDCKISAFCWLLLTEAEYDEYPLAHQVFYLTVAKSMNCLSKMSPLVQTKVEHKIELLCSSMYRANLKIEAQNYPSKDQDLFMQNIAFCSLNVPFKPFRQRYRWLEAIMQMQSWPKGCFTVDLRQLARLLAAQSRPKRRDRLLPDGCSLHKTSMGLASIASYIQHLVVVVLRHSQEHFTCELN